MGYDGSPKAEEKVEWPWFLSDKGHGLRGGCVPFFNGLMRAVVGSCADWAKEGIDI